MIRGCIRSCGWLLGLTLAWTFFGALSAQGGDHPAQLFVADFQANPYGFSPGLGRVLAFDANTGQYLRTVISGLDVPSSMTIGPGGSLYVSTQVPGPTGNTGEVLKLDPTSTDLTPISQGVS